MLGDITSTKLVRTVTVATTTGTGSIEAKESLCDSDTLVSFEVDGSFDGIKDVEITKFDTEDSIINEDAARDVDDPSGNVTVAVKETVSEGYGEDFKLVADGFENGNEPGDNVAVGVEVTISEKSGKDFDAKTGELGDWETENDSVEGFDTVISGIRTGEVALDALGTSKAPFVESTRFGDGVANTVTSCEENGLCKVTIASSTEAVADVGDGKIPGLIT